MKKYIKLIIGCLTISANLQAQDILVVPTRTSPKCNGGTDGSIEVQIYGKNPPFQFVWETGVANQNLYNIAAGDYDITVTDNSGATHSETITLFDNPPISLGLYVRDIPCFMFCDGSVGTIVSGGVGNFTFLWSNGSTAGVIENLPPGWYSVTVTDGNGCTKSDSAFVYEPPEIVISIVQNSGACGGNNGTATASASGGTPPFTYLWSNGQTGPTITNAAPGTYYVQVTDANGCQKDKPVTIDLSNGLDVKLAISSAQCPGVAGATATAIVNPPSGNLIYNWNIPNSQGLTQIGNLAAGQTISVTVTDPTTGCIGSATATVSAHHQIEVVVADVDVNCAGDPTGSATAVASQGTAPYIYVWTLPNGTTVAGDQITGLTAGAYLVSVTDAVGCTAVGVADIGTTSKLTPDFNLNLEKCLAGNEVLVAFSDNSSDPTSTINSWNWTIQTGANSQSFSNQNPPSLQLPANTNGTVHLTITSAAGCIAQISKNFTTPQAGIQIQISDVDTDCANSPNGSATANPISGSAPFSYIWSNGAISQTISNLMMSNVGVTVTDSKNCSATGTANIDAVSSLAPDFNLNLVQCIGNQVVVNFTDNSTDPKSTITAWNWDINWTSGSQQTTGQMAGNFTLNPNESGTVELTVTSAAGCTATISEPFTAPAAGIQIQVTDTDTDCLTSATGSATATPLTGTSPFIYNWSNNQFTPTISNQLPGNVTVTVTDSKNCSATGVANIESASSLNADFNLNVVECLGNQVVVSISDASSDPKSTLTSWNWNIVWGSGSSQSSQQNPQNLTFQNNETGTITLVVTAANGCTATLTEPFKVDAVPDISFNVNLPVVSCDGAGDTIQVIGSPNYIYSWSPAAGLQILNNGQIVVVNTTQSTDFQLTVKNGGCEKVVNVPVKISPPIDLTASDDKATCADSETLTASSTAAGVNFQWFDGAVKIGTGSSIKVSGDTKTYTVVATDANGCTASEQVKITGQGADISLSQNPPASICENDPLVLAVVSGNPGDVLTYVWTSSSANLTIAPTNAATVTATGTIGNATATVVATNQFGCKDTLQIPLKIEDGESLSGKIKADLCNGREVKFENLSNFTGTWNFGDGQTSTLEDPTHTYLTAGNFTVTFTPTNATCVSKFDTTITVLPTAAVLADFQFDLKNCRDEAVFQFTDLSQHSNPTVQWAWQFLPSGQNSAAQNPLITFSQIGPATVILNVVDANGCFDADTVTIPYHIVSDNFEKEKSLCPGDSVELNSVFGTSYTYSWTANPPDPNLQNSNPNPNVAPAVQTTYTVLVSFGGCQITDTVRVTPKPAPSLTLPTAKTVCSDTLFQLSVTVGAGENVQWSTSPNFNPIVHTGSVYELVPVRDGKYYVRSTNADGCSTTGEVLLNNGSLEINSGNLEKMICLGMSTSLDMKTDALPADILTYSWSPTLPTIFNPIVNPSTSTNYTGFVVNQFGCGDTAVFKINVVVLAATASASKDSVCPGETTILTVNPSGGSNYSFKWMPEGSLDDSELQSPTATPTENTTYTVMVMDSLGCSATASVDITFINLQCAKPFIFVPTAFTPDGDDKNDRFMARTAFAETLYFVVYDRWGEKIFETEDPKDLGWDGTFKGRQLTPDAYGWYLKVRCGDGQEFVDKGNVTLLK